jgi:hypothetical protein
MFPNLSGSKGILWIMEDWMQDQVRHDENQAGLACHSREACAGLDPAAGIKSICDLSPSRTAQFRNMKSEPISQRETLNS